MSKDIDIKEVERDITDYVSRKYGSRIKIAVPGSVPEPAKDDSDEGAKRATADAAAIQFDMKPQELKAYLDEYMVKQDEAKQVLATKICTHFNRIKRFELNRKKKRQDNIGDIKNNIIMIGPTGVGKTYLIKLIANKIGVPFVKGDATKFSETGYVGGDVEDLVRDLVHEAKGNIELAQYGIIYLDEVDKLAGSHNLIGPDVSRSGVQRALLKPLEETEIELKVPHDPIDQMEAIQEFQKTGKRERKKISTRHILFIMSGAFNGLDAIVKKRCHHQGIGFGAEIQSKEGHVSYAKDLKNEDLIQYGFESEFIGRLPVVTVFESLETEDLYKILRNPKSPIIIGKKRDFKSYGIDLQFEDEALHKIAENAYKEGTGARALVSAVEHVLLKFEHALPSLDIHHLTVTPVMVDDPCKELEKIIANPHDAQREEAFQRLVAKEEERLTNYIHDKIADWQRSYGTELSTDRIRLIVKNTMERLTEAEIILEDIMAVEQAAADYAKKFAARNGIEISFTEGAVNALAQKTGNEVHDVEEYLSVRLRNYDHGLKLIREKSGKQHFRITEAGIEDPEQYLNEIIQEAYQ